MAAYVIILKPVNQACLSLSDVLMSPYYVWNDYYLVPQLDMMIPHAQPPQHIVFVCAYHVLSLPAASRTGTVWLIPLNRGGISGTIFQLDHTNDGSKLIQPIDSWINLTNIIDRRAFEFKRYTSEMNRVDELIKQL